MELKLDNSISYAIALEGGGAKGAYEIGVWKALEEAGIRYHAVSGTSVGALNGALMAMRDLPKAISVWNDMRLTKVMDLDGEQEENLKKILSGEIELSDIQQLIPQAIDIIRNRGLDVAPLRAWVHEVVDEKKIQNSDVDLYVSTVSLSDRKGLELKVNDLPAHEICDMLLASAYHPSFRLEKLGGKFYTDGGFVDTLPLHALVANGHKNIIAVRIPGMGVEKRFRIPPDVNVTYIHTNSDLGNVLNFTAEQARTDLTIGYYDAQRVLYGLYGRRYYVDRSLNDRQALDILLDHLCRNDNPRHVCERVIPRLFRQLNTDGSYFELLVAAAEKTAERLQLAPLQIYTDIQLLTLCGGTLAEVLSAAK